jgi:hypothetical protein
VEKEADLISWTPALPRQSRAGDNEGSIFSLSPVLSSSPVLLCAVKISKGLRQAYEFQDLTFQTALAQKNRS